MARENSKKLNLSEEQRGAVEHFKGPALVVAGPGSGKTLVITERVRYLISEKGIDPASILVTTFTNKAASELKVRLSRTLGKKAEIIHISTIHSMCKTLLEDYFTAHNLGAQFDVLDEETLNLFIRVNRDKLGVWKWKGGWIKKGMDESSVRGLYDFLTRNDVCIDDLKADLKSRGELDQENRALLDSYGKYLGLLDHEKKIDFANLQLKLYKLICQVPEILRQIQDRFQFIMVDEYQDTSPLQDKIFRMMAAPRNNIFVVGDENQSIYGFRGASIENFRCFKERFDRVKTYFLSTNFRSTENIVRLSNKLLKDRIRKELESRRRRGEKTVLIKGETADSVAAKTISIIKGMKSKGIITKYGDVALLTRTRAASEEYIKYLEAENIPYITFGDGIFLSRPEIRAMVYLLSYVFQKLNLGEKFKEWTGWWDADLFKEEVLGFSDATKRAIDNMDQNIDIHDFKTGDELKKIGIRDKEDALKIVNLNRLRDDVEGTAGGKAKDCSFLEIFYDILRLTGYMKRLLDKKGKDSEEKLYNLGKLSKLIRTYEAMYKRVKAENLLWFIYISARDKALDQYKIEDENTVKVMTIHKAKGLEFPVVFICSLLEGRFPLKFKDERARYLVPIDYKFYMDKDQKRHDEEAFYNEELRLFYVGITRAQDNLIFTTSDKIRVRGARPSRFLEGMGDYISSSAEMNLPIEKVYKIVEEVPNLTYSSINTYVDCPFRYMLIYKYGFVTPPIFMQNIGTFVHNVLQRIHKEIKNGNPLTPKTIGQFVDSYWIPVYSAEKKDENIKLKYLGYFKDYYEKAGNYYGEILEIEKPFSYIGDNMIIRGKVDLIARDKDGKVNLIDFKARKKAGIEKTNVDKQLKIYRHCLRDKNIDKLVAYTFMDNQTTPFDFDEKEIDDFLNKMSGDMKSKNFSQNKGIPFCRECNFNFLCGGDVP